MASIDNSDSETSLSDLDARKCQRWYEEFWKICRDHRASTDLRIATGTSSVLYAKAAKRTHLVAADILAASEVTDVVVNELGHGVDADTVPRAAAATVTTADKTHTTPQFFGSDCDLAAPEIVQSAESSETMSSPPSPDVVFQLPAISPPAEVAKGMCLPVPLTDEMEDQQLCESADESRQPDNSSAYSSSCADSTESPDGLGTDSLERNTGSEEEVETTSTAVSDATVQAALQAGDRKDGQQNSGATIGDNSSASICIYSRLADSESTVETEIEGFHFIDDDKNDEFSESIIVGALYDAEVDFDLDVRYELLRQNLATLEYGLTVQLMQLMLQENVGIDSILEFLARTLSQPVVSSPETHMLREPLDDNNVQCEDDNWSEETQHRCLSQLQVSMQCMDAFCEDENCKFWKEVVEDISSRIVNRTVFRSSLYRRILSIIADHAADCSEMFCAVPWCHFFHQCGDDEPVEEQIAALMRHYCSIDFDEDCSFDPDGDNANISFLQVDYSVEWPSVVYEYDRPYPTIGLDYTLFNNTIDRFGRDTAIGQSYTIPVLYLRMERYPLMEGSDNMWQSLQGAQQHPNIVHHLWCTYSHSTVNVCVDYFRSFGCVSLHEYLHHMRSKNVNLEWHRICFYVHGLVSATQYLHSRGILYLLWTTSSIFMGHNEQSVMLADFSHAVHQQTVKDDDELIDNVQDALPPHIVPPEIFEGRIGNYCDVWGIGCLLYEMATGLPLHYQQRHSPRENLRKYVKNFNIDTLQHQLHNALLQTIFVKCETRISLDEVAKGLAPAVQS
jgi:hypothetical protein